MERLNADIHDAQPSRTQGFMLPSARWARGILCTSVYYTLGKASDKKIFKTLSCTADLTHPPLWDGMGLTSGYGCRYTLYLL